MPAQEDQFQRISEKLQLLLKRMEALQKENDKLKETLQQSQARQSRQDEQLKELALRNEVLKSTKSKLSEDERKSLEKKINTYIREIDRCIASLQT